jgi:hypothetical protein
MVREFVKNSKQSYHMTKKLELKELVKLSIEVLKSKDLKFLKIFS